MNQIKVLFLNKSNGNDELRADSENTLNSIRLLSKIELEEVN